MGGVITKFSNVSFSMQSFCWSALTHLLSSLSSWLSSTHYQGNGMEWFDHCDFSFSCGCGFVTSPLGVAWQVPHQVLPDHPSVLPHGHHGESGSRGTDCHCQGGAFGTGHLTYRFIHCDTECAKFTQH